MRDHADDVLRFSSYTILSDRLKDGRYALLNSITGALDIIPGELGEALRDGWQPPGERETPAAVLHPQRTDQLLESLSSAQRSEFVQRGHVTAQTVDEERDLVADIARAVHGNQSQLPQFMVVPNLDCNYRCTYCFERPLQKGLTTAESEINYSRGNVVMTTRHVVAMYRAIEELQKKASRPDGGQIILYGGEPLDGSNRAIIEDIVSTGCRRGFVFSAVTNGHDLHEFIPLIGMNAIQQVQISIDGPKQVHDRRRIHLGGESSFDRIVRNVRLAIRETDAEIQLRVHVDPANIHLFEETLDLFKQEGWVDHDQVVIYANTVYEKDRDGLVRSRIDNGQIHERLREIASAHRNVCTSAPAVHARRSLGPVLEDGARFQVTGTYCAANTGNFIFAPDGHMYACWESVGKPCSRIGGYMSPEGVVLDARAVEKWFHRSVARIPECLTCSYALVCGGGCAQYAEYNNGTPFKPYCDDFQAVFSSALAEHVDRYFTSGRKGDERRGRHRQAKGAMGAHREGGHDATEERAS